MDETEYDGPRHRRVGLVRRVGCLPLLAAALVSTLLMVITVKMLESPTLWRSAPAQGLAWPDTIPVPTGPEPTEWPTEQPIEPPPTPTDVPPPPQTLKYEAEDASVWRGAVESNHTGYTGSGFVNYENTSGSFVQWTFDAVRPGRVTVRLRYANGTPANRPMDIVVNGQVGSAGLPFEATGAWTNWRVRAVDVDLSAGANIIRVVAKTSDGGPNVDYLEIRY